MPVWQIARAKQWLLLLPAVWILLLPMLYAWRIPVEYQFGRYLMPIIPFLVMYGWQGPAGLFRKISWRVIRRSRASQQAVLLVVFLVVGADLYHAIGRDHQLRNGGDGSVDTRQFACRRVDCRA